MKLPPPLERAGLARANAIALPFADDVFDLVVTSPPYFGLRSYQDEDGHYEGQIGDEATPGEFLDALIAVTAELKRVIKPTGSIFVNLGDKYAGSGGHNNAAIATPGNKHAKPGEEFLETASRRNAPNSYNKNAMIGDVEVRHKSLMLLPERYRVRSVDELGLIARSVIIWAKPNHIPESVKDRVARAHEDWVHLTKEPRYYESVDSIRVPYAEGTAERYAAGYNPESEAYAGATMSQYGAGYSRRPTLNGPARHDGGGPPEPNPLGKLPPSVWEIPTEGLVIPEWLDIKHYAAFPVEWPRRLIEGWSAPGHRVLDPFAGTGTVPAVARALGRYGVGVDLSRKYLRLAEWRVFEDERTYERIRGRKPPPRTRPKKSDETVISLF